MRSFGQIAISFLLLTTVVNAQGNHQVRAFVPDGGYVVNSPERCGEGFLEVNRIRMSAVMAFEDRAIIVCAPNAHPRWVEQPVPHWTCPPRFLLENRTAVQPACHALSNAQILVIRRRHGPDPITEERIFWTWNRTIPADGLLRIDFPAGFLNVPNCFISGDEGHWVQYLESEKDHLLLQGQKGLKLKIDCSALFARKTKEAK